MKILCNTMIFFTAMITISNKLIGQNLNSARGTALGANITTSEYIYSIEWNPACLITLNDWSIGLSNFLNTSSNSNNLTLYSMGIGKRFFLNQAAAILYSPGKRLRFVVPSTFSVYDSAGNAITTKFNQRITMSQLYSFGYAYGIDDDISIGLNGRYFENEIEDTRYFFDSNYAIQSQVNDIRANQWTFDIGMLYRLNQNWKLGLVLKNLFKLQENKLTDEFQMYEMQLSKIVQFGASFAAANAFTFNLDGDTKENIRFGIEFVPTNWLQCRSGLYTSDFEKVDAIGLGFGILYSPLQLDVGYLTFTDKRSRKGAIDINAYRASTLIDIDYTPFTADRITLSANVNLGRASEILARIDYVEMLSEIYTASYQIYAFRPVGKARIRNITPKPIDVKVRFFIKDIMNEPTETKAYTIPPKEILEIPFFAVFNDMITKVRKFSIYDGTVYVNAKISSDYDDKYQTRVLVRGRNDWNGDVLLLRYFVTPNDPDVLNVTRKWLSQKNFYLDTIPANLQNLEKAKIIFNSFAERLLYINDPIESKDYVQYPAETLSLNGGDCDDLTVCYSSLLMSIGIQTAFIDVIPPDRPENSHIYMIFDTGIPSKDAALVSENQKRYVIRKNEKGDETVWIPIETTVTQKGFNEAWNKGAEEYFNDAEVNFGIVRGWMHIVDLPITN